ncbi:hypothetical protein BDV28DRAFT_42778 [Aspergillus coremiiformis]|uniref:Uncharacterized protein n=1 Tax=Aspergillus coremiiformis TaxID=138285 RepID=A0A5N6ZEY9_9EURO|nr:hypothetical protein BDV28DRAFT_42778 [Aspergillus coremiiformis]
MTSRCIFGNFILVRFRTLTVKTNAVVMMFLPPHYLFRLSLPLHYHTLFLPLLRCLLLSLPLLLFLLLLCL